MSTLWTIRNIEDGESMAGEYRDYGSARARSLSIMFGKWRVEEIDRDLKVIWVRQMDE